jgi:hypothetical protein
MRLSNYLEEESDKRIPVKWAKLLSDYGYEEISQPTDGGPGELLFKKGKMTIIIDAVGRVLYYATIKSNNKTVSFLEGGDVYQKLRDNLKSNTK